MKFRDYLALGLLIVLCPAVLALIFASHWMGYVCGLIYGILEESWRELADQFRLGRYHMTGDGETHP